MLIFNIYNSIYNNSNLIIDNFYGEGFYCVSMSCLMFLVNNNSTLNLS